MLDHKPIYRATTALSVAAGLLVAAPLSTPDAHAFGWSDVTGAVKKVGGAVKDGAKKGASAVNETRKAVKKVVKSGQDAIRDASSRAAGTAAMGLGEEAGKLYEKARGDYDPKNGLSAAAKQKEIDGFVGLAGSYARAKDTVKGKIKGAPKKLGEKAMTGKITRLPPGRPGQWGGSGIGKTPGKSANQKATLALKKGRPEQQRPNKRPPDGKPQNVPEHRGSKLPRPRKPNYPNGPYTPRTQDNSSAKITLQKGNGSVGRDRSIWGRPVGQGNKGSAPGRAKMPVSRDRSVMGRPAGIRNENLQSRQTAKRIIRGGPNRSVRHKSGNNRVQQNHRPQTRDLSRSRGRDQSRNQQQNRNRHQGHKVRMHNSRGWRG